MSDADPEYLSRLHRLGPANGLDCNVLGEPDLQIKGLKDVEADGLGNLGRDLGIVEDPPDELVASNGDMNEVAARPKDDRMYEGSDSGSATAGLEYWCSSSETSGMWKLTSQTNIPRPFWMA